MFLQTAHSSEYNLSPTPCSHGGFGQMFIQLLKRKTWGGNKVNIWDSKQKQNQKIAQALALIFPSSQASKKIRVLIHKEAKWRKNKKLNCGSRADIQYSYQECGHYLKHASVETGLKPTQLADIKWLYTVCLQLELPSSPEKLGLATHPNTLFTGVRNGKKQKERIHLIWLH